MVINAERLLHGDNMRIDFSEVFSVPEEYDASNVIVYLNGTFANNGSFYSLEADASASLKMNCKKCLTPVQLSLEFTVSEGFSKEASPEEDFFYFDNEKSIDIKPAVELNLLLNIPMAVECGESCKGLCAKCGANLNEKTCGCDAEGEINPKFAALKTLFE